MFLKGNIKFVMLLYSAQSQYLRTVAHPCPIQFDKDIYLPRNLHNISQSYTIFHNNGGHIESYCGIHCCLPRLTYVLLLCKGNRWSDKLFGKPIFCHTKLSCREEPVSGRGINGNMNPTSNLLRLGGIHTPREPSIFGNNFF